MPYNVSWYEQNRVILVTMTGSITIDDLRQIDGELIRCIRDGIPLVHLLVDMRQMEKMPSNVTQVSGALQHLKEPNLGWTILIGASPVIRFAGSVVAQIARMRFRALPTFSESITFLASQDSTLIHLLDSSA